MEEDLTLTEMIMHRYINLMDCQKTMLSTRYVNVGPSRDEEPCYGCRDRISEGMCFPHMYLTPDTGMLTEKDIIKDVCSECKIYMEHWNI